MKKLKFTIKTAIAICAILAVTLFSCAEGDFPETPSKFVVIRIEPNQTKGTSLYLVVPIKKKT